MKALWDSFKNGFVGAFALAGAIVVAVAHVVGLFVRDGNGSHDAAHTHF